MNKNSIHIDEVIQMAWCDKTSFEEIQSLTGYSEPETITIMRKRLKPRSFRLWRKRVSGRIAKHREKKHAMCVGNYHEDWK
ncbi:TIGR03643 family protein [bacterium]|nr:TIGR03643 family protein [bacterium]